MMTMRVIAKHATFILIQNAEATIMPGKALRCLLRTVVAGVRKSGGKKNVTHSLQPHLITVFALYFIQTHYHTRMTATIVWAAVQILQNVTVLMPLLRQTISLRTVVAGVDAPGFICGAINFHHPSKNFGRTGLCALLTRQKYDGFFHMVSARR
jgi:hypothetical protein